MEISKTYHGGVFLSKEELKNSKIRNRVELEYYKTRKCSKLNEEENIYGIEVVKKEYGWGKVNIQSSSVDNICSNSSKISEIINILKRNTVTPNGLYETMDEILKQGITE